MWKNLRYEYELIRNTIKHKIKRFIGLKILHYFHKCKLSDNSLSGWIDFYGNFCWKHQKI